MPVSDKRLQRGNAQAPSLRVPMRAHGQDDRALSVHARRKDAAAHKPALRLALAKGKIGIELDAPCALGPLSLHELSLWFPGLRFPIDLSGGVPRFRHRRGELDRVAAELVPSALCAWAAPRLKGVLGPKTPELFVAPIESGALLGLRSDDQALAFDLIVAPMERDLRLIPEKARGIGLGAPPHLIALRALCALGSGFGEMRGGALVLSDAVSELVRHVLPNAGCRAPSVLGARWIAPSIEVGRFRFEAFCDAPPPELSARSIRSLELAELTGDADAAALAGDLDEARRKYVELLERAPRHREISERAAWFDSIAGGRAEAALSTLVDAVSAIDAGLVGAELLAQVGDVDGAIIALSQAAALEPYSALAALMWMRAANLSVEQDAREHALDEAVARSPLLESVRWARLSARLDRADVRGAVADAEHLEACARGVEARHAVWRRTAEAFLERGFIAEAETLFERSLRYAPESEEAVLGLAKSLRAAGKPKRALDLFARAAALSDKRGHAGEKEHAITLELARTLVDAADDRPAAIARLRRIPPGLGESAEARFLEGKFRAELGDWAGSGEALGRFRLEVERSIELAPHANEAWAYSVASMLLAAARIEEEERGELFDAQRMLGLALRLKPRDRAISAEFRRVSQALRAAAAALSEQAVTHAKTVVSPMHVEEETHEEDEEAHEASEKPVSAQSSQPFSELFADEINARGDGANEASAPDSVDELLIERLTARVRGNPDDHEAVFALIDALGRARRYLDLLALISARIEEGDDELRAALIPKKREVLKELSVQARAAGRASEAELYEMMAEGD